MKLSSFIACVFVFVLSVSFLTSAQETKKKVRNSPKASVMQVVGLTDVNIAYSRPGVKGRKIWGELVPYNKVWRAGADDATKFTFSTDVTIEGKTLPAGSYSFFVIPTEGEWTVIFNKVANQWGAYEYNEAQDALRLKVKPVTNTMTEWLTYSFSDMKNNSAVINFAWENLRLPLKVEVAVP